MKNGIAVKITLIYFITGIFWILFSDQLVLSISGSSEVLTDFQSIKGATFVAFTAFLLFLLIDREIKKKNSIQEDLIKAKERAEESDQLKSAFLANMSHEIRTPLNGILGFCELMLDDSFSKEDKEIFARHMNKNGDDFLKLINDIMDISKIQANQFIINKTKFNVNQLLDSIYDEYSQSELRMHRKEIDFILVKGMKNDDVELFSDAEKLAHVFQNLLNNSFFFTSQGSVRFGYDKAGNDFEFFIEDTGRGIDEKNRELIFKPFFKGKDPVIGNKGFGLGLAICKGLVKLLGGDLKFDSKVNVGTRFYFTLSNRQNITTKLESNGWNVDNVKAREISFDPLDINISQN
ncbi:MAG TPA: HAMP domain-containing sensor histidine kinase [Prolixibacteraceae bacterium]|nr:HAMP domain-containing sensor histidine kinase [Prolixibacteraceae bacterium]